MNPSPRNDYLQTEVMTATPQKLQLMLIEAALRLGHQVRRQWEAGEAEAAVDSLIRCQQVVAELLGGIQPGGDRDLVRRVAGVYLFVYRCLVAASLERNEQKLSEALSILEIERETWSQVCRQFGSQRAETAAVGRASFEA